MKIYKFVAYCSLAVVLLAGIVIATLPIRFPNSVITWKPIVVLFLPAINLVGLLFLKPHIPLKAFRLLLLMPISLAVIAVITGSMNLTIFLVFLMALGLLFRPLN